MNCASCQETISTKFVVAIKNNVCPACGGKIYSNEDYKRIWDIRAKLVETGLDEKSLISIAAVIANKFTLVPIELSSLDDYPEQPSAPVQPKPMPKTANQNIAKSSAYQPKANTAYDDFEDEDDDLSPEERAELIKEYGLTEGISPMSTNGVVPPMELLQEITNIGGVGGSADNIGNPNAYDEKADLLARARAAKERNSHMIAKRLS